MTECRVTFFLRELYLFKYMTLPSYTQLNYVLWSRTDLILSMTAEGTDKCK